MSWTRSDESENTVSPHTTAVRESRRIMKGFLQRNNTALAPRGQRGRSIRSLPVAGEFDDRYYFENLERLPEKQLSECGVAVGSDDERYNSRLSRNGNIDTLAQESKRVFSRRKSLIRLGRVRVRKEINAGTQVVLSSLALGAGSLTVTRQERTMADSLAKLADLTTIPCSKIRAAPEGHRSQTALFVSEF